MHKHWIELPSSSSSSVGPIWTIDVHGAFLNENIRGIDPSACGTMTTTLRPVPPAALSHTLMQNWKRFARTECSRSLRGVSTLKIKDDLSGHVCIIIATSRVFANVVSALRLPTQTVENLAGSQHSHRRHREGDVFICINFTKAIAPLLLGAAMMVGPTSTTGGKSSALTMNDTVHSCSHKQFQQQQQLLGAANMHRLTRRTVAVSHQVSAGHDHHN